MQTAVAELVCFDERLPRAIFRSPKFIYNCPKCGGLLEATYTAIRLRTPRMLKRTWRERRMSNAPLDQSGVWRYREMFPFLDDYRSRGHAAGRQHAAAVAPQAAQYGGLDQLTFKHQGFNPTGSFKDNGMTCGAAQAVRLGMKRVACVSTGNTSASMAAYASAGGTCSRSSSSRTATFRYGKLAQALEYGAKTLQVEANFDQILALVRVLAEQARNLSAELDQSVPHRRAEDDHRRDDGPARLEAAGLDRAAGRQSGQYVGVRQGAARADATAGLIDKTAAAGGGPGGRLGAVLRLDADAEPVALQAVEHPETLATAIKIGDPVSWPKALHEVTHVERSGGEGDRAGDRRRQGDDRAVRHRLRAGFGGDAGGHPQADGGGSDRARTPMWSRC